MSKTSEEKRARRVRVILAVLGQWASAISLVVMWQMGNRRWCARRRGSARVDILASAWPYLASVAPCGRSALRRAPRASTGVAAGEPAANGLLRPDFRPDCMAEEPAKPQCGDQ